MATKDAQLIDLQEVDERPRINFCTPKLMIITMLASYFMAQNIYNYIQNPSKPQENFKPVEIDDWEEFWKLF